MVIKRLLAYIGSFVFGGVPSVIELWMTEKDVKERTEELYNENLLSMETEENSDDERGDE